jgi:RNA polymerase sigma-70 factor (ECF subfamily)
MRPTFFALLVHASAIYLAHADSLGYDGRGMEEQELVRYAKEGDLQAFNRLVQEYQSRAFNLALRIMGDQDSAADATQEAFISAFRSIRRFRGGSFKAWLFRIVTNACYDEFRRRKRRPAVSLDELDEGGNGPFEQGIGNAPAPTPEEAVEMAELAREIQGCLDELPPEFRVVAVLADVQRFEYREIAEIIGKPLGTVKSRLARARARMRECLERHGELLYSTVRLNHEAIE